MFDIATTSNSGDSTVMKLASDSTSNSAIALDISGLVDVTTLHATADVLDITANNLTTANVVDIDAGALTTGYAIDLDVSGNALKARNTTSTNNFTMFDIATTSTSGASTIMKLSSDSTSNSAIALDISGLVDVTTLHTP